MSSNRLFKLPIDPTKVDHVRDYFNRLEDRRETFERGLALEAMNAETAWLDEEEPALYYLHDEGEGYPAEIDTDDIEDEAILRLSDDHQDFFEEVVAEGYDHPDDLAEFDELFHASARDRIQ